MKNKFLITAAPLLTLALPAASAFAAEAAAKAEEQPGLLDIDPQSVIWVLVIFIIVVIVLYQTAWKNVLGGLKSREERIRKDIADAETARADAERILRDYNGKLAEAAQKVQEMLSKATNDAAAVAAHIQADAEARARSAPSGPKMRSRQPRTRHCRRSMSRPPRSPPASPKKSSAGT